MSVETKMKVFEKMLDVGGLKDVKSLRGTEWLVFSERVLDHIETYTVPQYGDKPNDSVEEWATDQCIRQIGKYVKRWNTNQRGPEERFLDLVKIAHYACMAEAKLRNEQATAAETRRTFTVVGLYLDTGQKFCDFIEAHSAAAAEAIVENNNPDSLIVAGVFEGRLKPLDN